MSVKSRKIAGLQRIAQIGEFLFAAVGGERVLD